MATAPANRALPATPSTRFAKAARRRAAFSSACLERRLVPWMRVRRRSAVVTPLGWRSERVRGLIGKGHYRSR